MSLLRPIQIFAENHADHNVRLVGFLTNTFVNGAVALVTGAFVSKRIFEAMENRGYSNPARVVAVAVPLTIASAGGLACITSLSVIAWAKPIKFVSKVFHRAELQAARHSINTFLTGVVGLVASLAIAKGVNEEMKARGYSKQARLAAVAIPLTVAAASGVAALTSGFVMARFARM